MSIDASLLSELRAKLEEEKGTVEAELKRLGSDHEGPDAAFKDRGSDEDSNAQEVTEFQEDLSLEASLETTLGDVKEALQRMDDGTYGVCEECGSDIPVERLRALPRATTCVTCNE
ncbi:MAG: TraR/DksA C4-type zinc finger protein [Candidatus Doudnabacteria bacterium]|nr:TraR/DksA C4-type zinc finger protein [Candidatus Doudnabacteria bacterium]